jgi:TatD DNase family protein
MELIDTHCHLDLPIFDQDRDPILSRCKHSGINRIVIPGIDAGGWNGLLDLCERKTGLYPTLGLHPVYINKHHQNDIISLEEHVSNNQLIAIGEIGLDYYVSELDRDLQQEYFEAQLTIAKNAGLPVLLHVRKSHDKVLSTLKRIKVIGGIAHAFNGSVQQAQQYIDLGFMLGFGGMLTYEKAKKIRRLSKALSLDNIVLETDAPDMVISQHQGERNSPEYLVNCLYALSEIRDESPELVAEQTTRNACALLKI